MRINIYLKKRGSGGVYYGSISIQDPVGPVVEEDLVAEIMRRLPFLLRNAFTIDFQ